MNDNIKIKWIGPNTPLIKFRKLDKEVILSKRELKDLYSEIKDFMEYYEDNFDNIRLDYTDDY